MFSKANDTNAIRLTTTKSLKVYFHRFKIRFSLIKSIIDSTNIPIVSI